MKYAIIITLLTTILSTSCQRSLLSEGANEHVEVYNEFWNFANQNYIFFDQKEIRWDSVYTKSMSIIQQEPTEEGLYMAIEHSIKALKDRHSRAETTMGNIYGWDYTTGYDIHFDKEVIDESYLNGDVQSIGNVDYGVIQEDILYVRINKFMNYRKFVDVIKAEMSKVNLKSIIIDIRHNLGGDSNDLPRLLGNFTNSKILLGYYVEKTGPGHEDLTDPLPAYTHASIDVINLPIKLLINRKSYSASSYCAAMIKELPNAELIGQITGGGAGGNLSYQLSNGWIVAVSVSDFYDPQYQSIEEGVTPDIHVNNTQEELSKGVDNMLNTAIDRIRSQE